MKTGRYNLKELLTHNEIEQIIIPEIQRDYVWQKDHVSKLIHSILSHFGKKKQKKLTFHIDGDSIKNDSIVNFLQHEYDRLIYNLKLGFIYAYHDNEYAGKFFLIDGQQRITTLYLLLLCLYKKAGKQTDFSNLYFKNFQLKVDYKVREDSHDFMVQFVKNQLSKTEIDIRETKKYYTEYDNDITIQNIITNYDCIEDLLPTDKKVLKELIGFVEEFVEVNYFDTNLSQQGEQLYLYMNSRGKDLSFHEQIKSVIIEKIKGKDIAEEAEKKKNAGNLWEDWQNFFWEHRLKNENADIGFQEFLKWASIIQICTSDSEKNLEFKEVRVDKTFRRQSLQQAKENYIHQNPSRLLEQQQMLSNYQISNSAFDCEYLTGIFNALKYLYSLDSAYIPTKRQWLSGDISAIDYIVLCPILHFISKFKEEDKPKQKDIERLTMFLYNLTHFRSSLAKNPDSTTIYSIEMLNELCIADISDPTYFLSDDAIKANYKTILTESELFKLQILRDQDASQNNIVKRDDLEKFIWDITLNEDISKFLEGDISILFYCIKYEFPEFKEQLIYSPLNLDELKKYYLVLIKVIFNFRKEDLLRRALLTFGDYKSYHTGSDLLKPWMGKYSFVDSEEEWRCLFKDEKKNNIVISFMKEIKQHVNGEIKLTLTLSNLCTNYPKNDWKEPFIKSDEILKFCGNKKILWQNDSRIVLLSQINAGLCEIQIMLLKLKIDKAFTHSHNVCVIDFNIESGIWANLDVNWNRPDRYAIDIKYKNSEWRFSILYRNKDVAKQKLAIFEATGSWVLEQKDNDCLRAFKSDNLLYTDDPSKSIMENVEEAYKQVKNLQKEVIQMFAENEVEVTVDNTLES
jgi:uncharacterized protein with ParB-like and HNH nuclease domain